MNAPVYGLTFEMCLDCTGFTVVFITIVATVIVSVADITTTNTSIVGGTLKLLQRTSTVHLVTTVPAIVVSIARLSSRYTIAIIACKGPC